MLYEVLSQPYIFLVLSCGGFLCGFLFDIKNILLSFLKKKNIPNQILLFFAAFFTLFVCFAINLKTNYGELRLFSVLAFALAFAIERFFAQNFLAKPLAKCYNSWKGRQNERRRAKKLRNDERQNARKPQK